MEPTAITVLSHLIDDDLYVLIFEQNLVCFIQRSWTRSRQIMYYARVQGKKDYGNCFYLKLFYINVLFYKLIN